MIIGMRPLCTRCNAIHVRRNNVIASAVLAAAAAARCGSTCSFHVATNVIINI